MVNSSVFRWYCVSTDSARCKGRSCYTLSVKDRTERGFHYNQIPTDVYRTAFGYLACNWGSRNSSSLVVPVMGEESAGAPLDRTAGTPGKDTQVYGLPSEIFEAGETKLTGVIAELLYELRDSTLELRAILALRAGKPRHRRKAGAGQREKSPTRPVNHHITQSPQLIIELPSEHGLDADMTRHRRDTAARVDDLTGVDTRSAIVVSSLAMLIAMVEAGEGSSMVPSYALPA